MMLGDAGDAASAAGRCARAASPHSPSAAFRRLHLLSSAAYSLSHGLNDAQKTMGIITVLLYSTGYLDGEVPCAALGGVQLLYRDRARHADRRLEDHRDDGLAASPSCRSTRASRASTGGSIMVFGASCSAFRCRPRTRSPAAIIGAGVARRASRGALGRRGQCRRGVAHHHPGERGRSAALLPALPACSEPGGVAFE